MDKNTPPIMSASVRIMLSYNYSHFEFILGTTGTEQYPLSLAEVDELRKAAMRLADKAVAQYQIAKADAEKRLADKTERKYLVMHMNKISKTPEEQRAVGDQAKFKAYQDEAYNERQAYDYEDDWQGEDDV